jgi:hypothetical protein
VTITVAGNDEVVLFNASVDVVARSVTTLAATAEVGQNASTSFSVASYDDDALTPSENESAIRAVHLSPDALAVDVTAANGSVVLANTVTFRNASDHVTVPAGNYTVEIRQAIPTNDGEVLTTVNVSVAGGEAYAAWPIGYVDTVDAPANAPFDIVTTEDVSFTLQLPETPTPAPGNETVTPTETPGNETGTETETEAGTETATDTEGA